MNTEWLRTVSHVLPDKTYIQLQYFYHFHKLPNLKNPKTFNEKLQWLKLYDRNPLYTIMVDKVLAKEYVASIIGEEHIIPTLGVWDRAEDIDFDALPEQFVLKTNHDSGGVVVCSDKKSLDREKTVNKLKKALKKNGYWYGREWPYKNITPKVFAEKYMSNDSVNEEIGSLLSYKFYCFDGEPRFLYVGVDRIENGNKGELLCTYYDTEWEQPPFNRPDHRTLPFLIDKPVCFNRMMSFSRQLSNQMPFARVDLYEVSGEVFFSEITLCPGSGYSPFYPLEWERKIGDWIRIPEAQ